MIDAVGSREEVGLAGRRATTSDAVAPPRKWWLLERSARSLELFRIVAASALFMHFTMHFVETAQWLGPSSLLSPGEAHGAGRDSWLAAGWPLWALRTVFASAAGASLAIGLGLVPRLFASYVLFISVSTYWAILPLAGIDDLVANVTALFLVLAPIGRSRCVTFTGASARYGCSERVPSLSVCVLLVAVSFFYIDRGFGALFPQESQGALLALAAAAIPVAYVLPATWPRIAGVAVQLGLHGYLIFTTQLVVSNIVLAATALLFWGESPSPSRRTVLDGGGAASIALVVLGGAAVVASLFAGGANPAARILADVGVLPVTLNAPPTQGASVQVISKERVEDLPAGRLGGTLVSRLSNPDETATTRFHLAEVAARRFCREHGYRGESGRLVLLADGEHRRIADFECGSNGSLSYVR